ncbi:hypothetical protein BDM02DRAFT_3111972 [Thelephora ganbajun]|uniref:Uncharacterized protein n=1 Tax=Thelephora ganbajun TaxID=370292 RepID=A0ACB6ZM42_THEGA|nr:hypothetical protein BDM02DRAFT_3111972 [Thelephora ganbajun]
MLHEQLTGPYCRLPISSQNSIQRSSTHEPKINRLPPEILAKILECRMLDQDLVVATHVCRYWRSTLISTPCLWTHIKCYNSDSVSAYLERSKTAPINVLAFEILSTFPQNLALEKCIPHLGRVRLMMIYASFGKALPAIYNFRSPAPLLQRLEISGPGCDPTARLPDDFLGRHAPLLQHLHLEDSPLLLNPFPLPSLTTLTLYAEESQPPMSAILGLLSSAPSLQNISIAMMDVSTKEIPIHDIYLGSLRHLEVLSGSILSRVIPHIKAPKLEELVIKMPSGIQVPTIEDLLPPESYPLMTEVTSMDFRGVSWDPDMTFEGKGAKVFLTTHFPTPAGLDDFFLKIPSLLFAQITRLKIREEGGPLVSRIAEFKNLERIELGQCIEEDVIFEALCPSSSPESTPLVPCPHLEIMQVELRSPKHPTPENLARMARLRKEVGYALGEIQVSSSLGFSAEDEKILNDFLGKDHVRGS